MLAPRCENRCSPDSKAQPIRKRAGDLERKTYQLRDPRNALTNHSAQSSHEVAKKILIICGLGILIYKLNPSTSVLDPSPDVTSITNTIPTD
jgi:hypothetical protein